MGVFHILKDGTQVDSIRGHVVKVADAEPLYRMIHSINNGTACLNEAEPPRPKEKHAPHWRTSCASTT